MLSQRLKVLYDYFGFRLSKPSSVQKQGMSKICSMWVPKQLTKIQKASWVTIAKEQLGRFNHDKNYVLNCFVTGDDMWIHYAEPETKAQSQQWKLTGSPPLKKFKLSQSAGKVTLVAFWDLRGTILTHFMPKSQRAAARYCSEVFLKQLKEKLKKSRPRLVQKNVLLLNDNAPLISSTVELTNIFKWRFL